MSAAPAANIPVAHTVPKVLITAESQPATLNGQPNSAHLANVDAEATAIHQTGEVEDVDRTGPRHLVRRGLASWLPEGALGGRGDDRPDRVARLGAPLARALLPLPDLLRCPPASRRSLSN